MNQIYIQQKIALITGASSGFGRLIAFHLAQHGYHVIATMRNIQHQQTILEEAMRKGIAANITCMLLDVTDSYGIRTTVTEIIDRFGRIDILVNNAGFAIGGFIEEISLDDWRHQMETNFFGLVSMTQAVLPYMRQQRSGHILNMSSISGRVGFPGLAPYAASKHAVEGYSESLRLEMLPFGVQVILLEPGSFKTDIWAKGFDQFEAQMTSQPDSPYYSALQKVYAYSQKSASEAEDPQIIADTVLSIVQSPAPAFRYVLGKGTKLTLLGKMLLPWKWFERIILKSL